MFDYIGQVVADKRSDPGDDILTALIQAEEAGDRLDTEEIQAQVMLLYIAGHETTANLIGNGLTNLFRFPEQMDILRADPGLDANAVEEMLRYDSPAQFTRRVNQEPLEVDGVTIPEGSLRDPGARLGQPRSTQVGPDGRRPRRRPARRQRARLLRRRQPTSAWATPWRGWRPRSRCPSWSAASPAWQPADVRAGLAAPHHPARRGNPPRHPSLTKATQEAANLWAVLGRATNKGKRISF